jgi:acyl carrier protein
MNAGIDIDTLVRGTIAAAAKRGTDDISASTELASLAVDSLSLTTLIAQLEATFSMELSPDDKMAIYDADDIGTIVAVAQAARSAQQGA